jgi:hypothetical protein
MSKGTLIKKLIKFLILASFIIDKVYFYQELKIVKTDKTIVAYELDISKINLSYNSHHLMSVSIIRTILEKLKEFFIRPNKVPEPEYNFLFLTAYNFLIFTILIIVVCSDRFFLKILVLFDAFLRLKVLILNSFIKDLINIFDLNFAAILLEAEKISEEEKIKLLYFFLNGSLFVLLLFLTILGLIEKSDSNLKVRQNEQLKKDDNKSNVSLNKNSKKKENDADKNFPIKLENVYRREENSFEKTEIMKENRKRRDSTPSKRRQIKETY